VNTNRITLLICVVFALNGCAQTSRWQAFYAAGQQAEKEGRGADADNLYKTAVNDAQSSGVNEQVYLPALESFARSSYTEAPWKEVLAIAKRHGLNREAEHAYAALGGIYNVHDRNAEGKLLALDQLEFAKTLSGDRSEHMRHGYCDLALFEERLGDIANSLKHYDQAEKFLPTGNDQNSQLDRASYMECRAFTEAKAGHHDQAVLLLRKAIAGYKKGDPDRPIAAEIASERLARFVRHDYRE
jgi:tetratricopeptide (TPR) repeat protein